MKPEIKKIYDLAKKCKESFKKIEEEVRILSNFKCMLENDGDDMSPDSLVSAARVVSNTMKLTMRLGTHDGSLVQECEDLVQEMENFEQVEIRNHFNALIGKNKVNTLEENYTIEYSKKSISVYKTDEIEMNFIFNDQLGDKVCSFSLCYNFDEQAFTIESCMSDDEFFDTYEEVKAHNKSKEKDIIGNNFPFIDLP